MMVSRRRVVILQTGPLPIPTVTRASAILLCLHLSWTITGMLSVMAMRRSIAMGRHRHPAIKVERSGAVGRMGAIYIRDPDSNLIEISNYV